MNEISPSQQNRPSPVRRLYVTDDEIRKRLAHALQEICREKDDESYQAWLSDMVRDTGKSMATIDRAKRGKDGLAATETIWLLMGAIGPVFASKLLEPIGMKAVSADDELAELRKRCSEQDMLLKNLWGLLKADRAKRGAA